MLVFEIIIPGTFLNYEDRDWSWNIQNQLRSLELQFFEANTALNLFIRSSAVRPSFANRDNLERDSQRRSEIQRTIEQVRGGIMSGDNWNAIHFEAEVHFK